ncbi:MAG: hypothetical protein DRI84_10095 [Bacteroidetes bacterium]|nr:MAG: hypothetical protein DRI84_10095 [Bacteroidota bacterium]
METEIIQEVGYNEAIQGIGYSFGVNDKERLKLIAEKLSSRDGGHNKFLESMVVWVDINAPRYFWSEFDTYRVGTTKQSQSTIHTITHRTLKQDDFEHEVYAHTLISLNKSIVEYQHAELKEKKYKLFMEIKNNLPEGFLQRRMVCTNYKVLKNIILQRKNHKLKEWGVFISALLDQLQFPHFVTKFKEKD